MSPVPVPVPHHHHCFGATAGYVCPGQGSGGILRTFVTFLLHAYYDRPLNGVTLAEKRAPLYFLLLRAKR